MQEDGISSASEFGKHRLMTVKAFFNNGFKADNSESLNPEDLFLGKLAVIESASVEQFAEAAQYYFSQNSLGENSAFEEISDFIPVTAKVRESINKDSKINKTLQDLLTELGLEDAKCDKVRPRVVPAGFHNHPDTTPVSLIHRDSWYANPLSQINLWIPVYPVTKDRSFGIYTGYFDRPVANTSDRFDYEEFKRKGGFQSRPYRDHNGRLTTGQHYPAPLTEPHGPVFKPVMEPGKALLFCGSHLHGTMPNTSEKNRFTLEIRLYCERFESAGAVANLDTRCRGRAQDDYRSPFEV